MARPRIAMAMLMSRSPAYERGGVWGTGRFPTLSGRRGHVGETWFPPRPRAEGERCSCGRVPPLPDLEPGMLFADLLVLRIEHAPGAGHERPPTRGLLRALVEEAERDQHEHRRLSFAALERLLELAVEAHRVE